MSVPEFHTHTWFVDLVYRALLHCSSIVCVFELATSMACPMSIKFCSVMSGSRYALLRNWFDLQCLNNLSGMSLFAASNSQSLYSLRSSVTYSSRVLGSRLLTVSKSVHSHPYVLTNGKVGGQ